MEKLILNFFGETISVDPPENLESLKQTIIDKFAFSPTEIKSIIISYIKDLSQKIIENENDFKQFISSGIHFINLDIKQDSKIFIDSLNSIQKENDEKKLEILLKKKQELKNERDKILENKKNKISILDKKYKEENKKKIELMKSLDMQLKQIKNEQNKFIKELHQSAKKFDKKENELSLEIIELQKKLCIPITEQAKIPTPHKKKIVKKRKNKKKFITEKIFLDGINNVINKMIEKINNIVNIQIENEQKNIEKTEKKIQESQILLKPEEQKCFVDLKKITSEVLKEIIKWTKFIVNHTNELTQNLSNKYKNQKSVLDPIEKKFTDAKKEIHYFFGCDGCEMFPIKGIRYHCKNCDNFDLCEKCFLSKKNLHKHEFEVILKSKFEKPDLPVHKDIVCDGCGMNPIKGCRYKCAECENFDYCEKCEEEFCGKKHLHPFIKINIPGEKMIEIKSDADEKKF